MSATHTIAIIGAMPQEIELLKQSLEGAAEMRFGRFSVHHGTLAGKRVVLAQSGIGKSECRGGHGFGGAAFCARLRDQHRQRLAAWGRGCAWATW